MTPNEEAPAGQGEGNDQNTNTYEGEPIMTQTTPLFPNTLGTQTAIRGWADQYVAGRRAAIDELRARPDFQEFVATETGGDSPWAWTEQDAVNLWMKEGDYFTPPLWPVAATPWWASKVEVAFDGGGEVSVTFERECGEYAAIVGLVSVVVDDGPQHDRNHPGARVGDVISDGLPPTIKVRGDVEDMSAADAGALFDGLAEAIAVLRKIEASAR